MRKASVLAVPSIVASTGYAEGLPIVLLEAAALGVPVLGTQHAGIPEAVIDQQTGYLVPERDVTALRDRLLQFMPDGTKRRWMGLQARALIEQRFDIRARTNKLEAFYDSVLQ